MIKAGLGVLTLLSSWRYVCFLLPPNVSCVPGRLAVVCSAAPGTVGHLESSAGGLTVFQPFLKCGARSYQGIQTVFSPLLVLLNRFTMASVEGWMAEK